MTLRFLAVLAAACVLHAAPAEAQIDRLDQDGRHAFEIAPFAGYGFGGDFVSEGRAFNLGGGLAYGGTVEVALGDSDHWSFTALYSRRANDVSSPFGAVSLAQERYMAGIVETKGATGDGARFFGAALLGATRFAPRGFDSATKGAAGLILGVKFRSGSRLGLRMEGRGFLTFAESGGGIVCSNGACLFSFSGTAFLQGELGAGLTVGF
jgi:hypothetical protein